MTHRDIYLICGEHIHEVEGFLSRFFEKKKDTSSHPDQTIFVTPDAYFQIILISGLGQPLTRGVNLEILYESIDELNKFARINKVRVKKFLVPGTDQPRICHFAEVLGPQDICRIRGNYCKKQEE